MKINGLIGLTINGEFTKNTSEIKWINKVHERLDGFKTYTALPDDKTFTLFILKQLNDKKNKIITMNLSKITDYFTI